MKIFLFILINAYCWLWPSVSYGGCDTGGIEGNGPYTVLLTGYRPDGSSMEGKDESSAGGKNLKPSDYTLEKALAGKAPWVMVAIPQDKKQFYKKEFRIPEIERQANGGKPLIFRSMDHFARMFNGRPGPGPSKFDIVHDEKNQMSKFNGNYCVLGVGPSAIPEPAPIPRPGPIELAPGTPSDLMIAGNPGPATSPGGGGTDFWKAFSAVPNLAMMAAAMNASQKRAPASQPPAAPAQPLQSVVLDENNSGNGRGQSDISSQEKNRAINGVDFSFADGVLIKKKQGNKPNGN